MNNRDGINSMIVSDYFSKDTEFSASDFTQPNYKLWVSKNCKKNEDDEQGFKAWVGQLIHDASYNTPEINAIKEFSFVYTLDLDAQIGGSVDRCIFNGTDWNIEDLKSMGNFPASKAFKDHLAGITKEEWIIQESIYKLGMKSVGLQVSDKGIIHQYVMGYQKNSKLPEYKEYNKLEIPLMSDEDTKKLIREKIAIARGKEPLVVDCKSYLCKDYCSYNKSCPSYKGE